MSSFPGAYIPGCEWRFRQLRVLLPVLLLLCLALTGDPPQAGEASLTLTLTEAKELARLQNPGLAVLQAEREQASGTELRARRAFLPSLSARLDYLRADSSLLDAVPVPDLAFPPSIVYRDLGPIDAYASSVQLTQPLVNLDAWHGHAQARHQVAARRFAVNRGVRELGAGVVQAYYGVQMASDRTAAVAAALAAANAALELAEAAYDEGLAASVDVYRARAEAAGRRAQLARAQGEVTAAKAQLREILGVSADTNLVLVDAIPPPEEPSPGALGRGARADIRALERGLDAAESGVRRAGARFAPRLNLLARQQWLDDDEAFGGDFDGWLVAMTLSWSPFAGMDQVGQRAEANATRRKAREELRSLRDQAVSEREVAGARWQAVFRAWEESSAALKEARRAAELAEGRYRQGVGNMSELLGAQAALAKARIERAETRYQNVLAAEVYRLAAGLPNEAEK